MSVAHRIAWLTILIGLAFGAVSPAPQLAAQQSAAEAGTAAPTNVVIILADDLGFSDVGCYGGETATPNLDRLAAHGLRFSQFYNTGRCWPTRASLMTGYYPQQVRRDAIPPVIRGGQGVRPAWSRLLPERLAEAGYRSYHVGKWHLDSTPLQSGFAHSYRLDDHGRFFAPRRHYDDDRSLPAPAADAGFYVTTEMADRAIAMLDDHAAEHGNDPYLLYLAFTAPHFPLHALPEDIARYEKVFDIGWDQVRNDRLERQRAMGLKFPELSEVEPQVGPPYHFPDAIEQFGPHEVNRPLPWDSLTAEQRHLQARKMAIHAAMIDRMDREIGRVLERIQAQGDWDETLIVFLSDNGASAEMMIRDDGHDPNAPAGSAATHFCLGPGWSNAANTPFRRHKTWVHEGGIRTPCIVHWPRGIPQSEQGSWRTAPGHAIDWVPTILQLAGIDALPAEDGAEPLAGRDLSPIFAADVPLERDYLWWFHEGNRALRIGDRKLVAAGADGVWELYDLATDPTESHDLAASLPDVVREMSARWQSITDSFAKTATRDLPADLRVFVPSWSSPLLATHLTPQRASRIGGRPLLPTDLPDASRSSTSDRTDLVAFPFDRRRTDR